MSDATWATRWTWPSLPWPFGDRRQTAMERLLTQTRAAVAEQRALEQALHRATLDLDVLRALIDKETVA